MKLRKPSGSECPLCRSLLSPLPNPVQQSTSEESNNMQFEISNQLKFAVIQAASRGRNAVRMAMLRAQQIRNSDDIPTELVSTS